MRCRGIVLLSGLLVAELVSFAMGSPEALLQPTVVEKSQIPLPPIEAPEGFRWVLNEPYSDEFNGTELDADKWHDTYPGWKGRVPGLFVPSSIRVGDGCLQIKTSLLEPPQGVSNEWWIACGAVQSKAQEAFYGYYETRVKASSMRTSTTFWLMTPRKTARDAGKRTELDIQESIGDATRYKGFKKQMKSNTHITFYEKGKEPVVVKEGASSNLKGEVDERFFRFGCWWVDANTMHFYVDGEYAHTIEPPTDLDPHPFDQKMFVNMVCEIYNFEVRPEREEILNEENNTTLYDYVRAYTLEPIERAQ